MIGTPVGLDGRELVGDLALMIGRVRFAAAQSVFLIHPGNDANRAAWMKSKLPNETGCLHCDRHARAVVNRARSQIPGIKMSGNDHDLLGVLAALQISNDVVA